MKERLDQIERQMNEKKKTKKPSLWKEFATCLNRLDPPFPFNSASSYIDHIRRRLLNVYVYIDRLIESWMWDICTVKVKHLESRGTQNVNLTLPRLRDRCLPAKWLTEGEYWSGATVLRRLTSCSHPSVVISSFSHTAGCNHSVKRVNGSPNDVTLASWLCTSGTSGRAVDGLKL